MKKIKLTQGQEAIVDDWRYEELSKHKWHAQWRNNTKSYYATYSIRNLGIKRTVLMHAVVAQTPRGMQTDHINHNTLDNREENLRVVTISQNAMNRKKTNNRTSAYIGVSWHKRDRRWCAAIITRGEAKYLGSFICEEDAARAYDAAAKKLHGEFAMLNFSERDTE